MCLQASKAIADIVRTTLGPSSMLKMLLDPMGGIVMTNDGNSILREVSSSSSSSSSSKLLLHAPAATAPAATEVPAPAATATEAAAESAATAGVCFCCFWVSVQVDVAHPAAKTMIELSRSQDEEVGDGSTSVVVLAGEVLSCSLDLLEKQQLHPTVISHGFMRALDDALTFLSDAATSVDTSDDARMLEILDACLCTKFASRWQGLLSRMALEAARKVARKLLSGHDTRRWRRSPGDRSRTVPC
ncbi:hypothetical protein ACSSS7_005894 [Eimeria intestinalis]